MESRRGHPQDRQQTAFAQAFGDPEPTHLVRAPGRVNLIGEHTDYNGLPVFPMAIQRDVRILCRARSDATVRLVNLDPQFEPCSFEINASIPPNPAGAWGNYVKAAAQALASQFGAIRGFDGVVAGDIPVAAGLSSSSALVVATGLLLVELNGLDVERDRLAHLLAQGERYVGTQGGGMDHAISLGGRRDTAFVIEFDPLRLTAVPIPLDWCFVVASSLVPAAKSGSAQTIYNERTRECRAALTSVLRTAGMPATVRFPELMSRLPLESLVTIGETSLDGPLQKRFRHVVTEAARVVRAREAMRSADLRTFGSLMSDSHQSLRDDYEVSCAELDELVGIAQGAGAVGARLTGAGFGGCTVALCRAGDAAGVRTALDQGFYAPRSAGSIEEHTLIAEPSDGASVSRLAASG
jgi:galactokinase